VNCSWNEFDEVWTNDLFNIYEANAYSGGIKWTWRGSNLRPLHCDFFGWTLYYLFYLYMGDITYYIPTAGGHLSIKSTNSMSCFWLCTRHEEGNADRSPVQSKIFCLIRLMDYLDSNPSPSESIPFFGSTDNQYFSLFWCRNISIYKYVNNLPTKQS
jgi:hypothetical protein